MSFNTAHPHDKLNLELRGKLQPLYAPCRIRKLIWGGGDCEWFETLQRNCGGSRDRGKEDGCFETKTIEIGALLNELDVS